MRATTANAARMLSIACRSRGAHAVMTTSVPSHTSALRTRNAASTAGQCAFIDKKQPADAVGDVTARERGARNIADVRIELDGIARMFANELSAPCRQLDCVAVRFAEHQHVKRLHCTGGIERQ